MGMALSRGGHLPMAGTLNLSGSVYKAVPYRVGRETKTLDYDAVRELALEQRPKLIVAGYSSYPHTIDSPPCGGSPTRAAPC